MEKYDVVIVGGGPGGLTAGIYASRANLKTIFVEKEVPGGKMVKTAKIENWSGDISVDGPDLSMRMFAHAQSCGVKYMQDQIVKIESITDEKKILILKDNKKIQAKAIIIATGMKEKIPEKIINIRKFENKGVSYCAICDGPLFKDKDIAVIGGGNSAIEEAIYLSSIANKIYVIVKFGINADKKSLQELKRKSNVTIYLKSEILALYGKHKLESALVKFDDKEKIIKIAALFPYIGQLPTSEFVNNLDITDKNGYIKTNENMETKIKNIFAVGDVRFKNIRQISTAVADGTIAAKFIANKITK